MGFWDNGVKTPGLGDAAASQESIIASKKMQRFESENPVSAEAEYSLAFGAVLFTQSGQSSRMLKLTGLAGKPVIIKNKLKNSWELTDSQGAINTLAYLSVAGGHTQELDAAYKNIVTGHMRETNEYISAKNILLSLDYPEHELSELPTLAAWDYGRCPFIARDSFNCGWIDEATAWKYMLVCAENASKAYSGWRQYLASYVLGRSLWGSDCKDLPSILEYLLKSSNSPYQRLNFKK